MIRGAHCSSALLFVIEEMLRPSKNCTFQDHSAEKGVKVGWEHSGYRNWIFCAETSDGITIWDLINLSQESKDAFIVILCTPVL